MLKKQFKYGFNNQYTKFFEDLEVNFNIFQNWKGGINRIMSIKSWFIILRRPIKIKI
jgi:hypothetical protein